MSGSGLLQRVFAALAGPDADRLLDRSDEDLSITDPSGAGDREDRLDHVADDVILDDDLHADLLDEVHDIGRPAVDLFFSTGPAKAFDLVDGHALNPDLAKAVLHIVQLEGLDDGFDFFHDV